MTAQELKEKLATLMSDMERTRKENDAQAKDDQRTAWLPEQADTFETLANSIAVLQKQISTEEMVEGLKEEAERSAGLTIAPRANDTPLYSAPNSIEALQNWLYTGYYNGQYTERIQLAAPDLTEDEMLRESSMRALATGSGEGAHVIPGETIAPLVRKLYLDDPVRASGARVITTPNGNAMSIPRLGRGSTAVPIVAEAADSANLDPDLSDVPLNAYVYRAHNDFSREFEQDHGANLIAELPRFWSESVGAARAAHHMNGTNSSQPQGIASGGRTTSGSGQNTISDAIGEVNNPATMAEFYQLLGFISPPYWTGLSWFMSGKTFMNLAQLSDANNVMTYNPNFQDRIPARLFGIPIRLSADISDKAGGTAGNVFIVLFNTRYYTIRDVRGFTLTRDASIVSQKNQVRMYFQSRGDAAITNGSGTYAYFFQAHN